MKRWFKMPQTIIIADSTQLTCFDECPTRWFNRYVKKITRTWLKRESFHDEEIKAEKQNTRDMGTVMHKMLELRYKRNLTFNQTINEALNICSAEGLIITPEETKLVIDTYRFYHAHYMINPDFYIKDPQTVELGFSQLLYEDEYYKFILEGRIDLAEANIGGPTGISCTVDHKSQARVKRLYTKAIQFRNYAMVLNTNFFVVNYIRFNKNPTVDTFAREIIPFSPLDHKLWKKEITQLFFKMANFKLGYETFGEDYNQEGRRRSSCSGQYGMCEYTLLCDESNKDMLVNIEKMNYEHKEPFKPW
jgi:hypothetical protein